MKNKNEEALKWAIDTKQRLLEVDFQNYHYWIYYQHSPNNQFDCHYPWSITRVWVGSDNIEEADSIGGGWLEKTNSMLYWMFNHLICKSILDEKGNLKESFVQSFSDKLHNPDLAEKYPTCHHYSDCSFAIEQIKEWRKERPEFFQ